MKKKYSKPTIKKVAIHTENILAASGTGINRQDPTHGLNNNQPGNKGQSDGSHDVGAKYHAWSLDWDEEEWEQ